MTNANRVKIGPINYEIKTVKKLRGKSGRIWGDIKYAPSRIRLSAHLGPQARRITLWHEMLHAVLTQSGQHEHDERQLDILAHGIVAALRDNPWLLDKSERK